jgi:hypothetical protein
MMRGQDQATAIEILVLDAAGRPSGCSCLPPPRSRRHLCIDDRGALAGMINQTAPPAAGRTRPLEPARLVAANLDSLSPRAIGSSQRPTPTRRPAAAAWLSPLFACRT